MPDWASDWPEAADAGSADAGSSRTALLALLRSEGAPATAAVCIPRWSTEAVISSLARGLVELLSTEQRRCGGLRALPDAPGDDFFGQDGEDSVDDCPLPDLPGAVRLASPRWLQSAVEAVGQLMPRGAACLRFEAGNGRIGLMLRRCPPLLATVRLPDVERLGCSSEGDDQLSSLLLLECRRAALMLTLRKAFEAEAAALEAEYTFYCSLYFCRSYPHSALNTLLNTVFPPSRWRIHRAGRRRQRPQAAQRDAQRLDLHPARPQPRRWVGGVRRRAALRAARRRGRSGRRRRPLRRGLAAREVPCARAGARGGG